MPDRVTTVTLRAKVDEYYSEMARAAAQTRELGTEAQRTAQKAESFQTLGRYALTFGAALTAGLTVAIAKSSEFDQAMSNVDAAMHETAENQELLRDAALEAGAATVFSATESANAIEELGKAGIATTDILGGGLTGALDLAAAGGLGVADAAGIASTALKTFNLSGSDMSHVADLLAAGAGKAMGDVSDLSMALNQAGLVAKNTGLSIEETTAGLAAFASQGLLGSDAGTSFRTMLMRLTPQSKEAAEEMSRLGVSAYDSSGQFIGLAQFAGNLRDSLADLTPEARNAALGVMFGSDAIRAATVLFDEGADGIANWINQVNDAGYAADTAAARLDNLRGDAEQLGGALDTALITTGSMADGVLRALTQRATEVVDAYNDAGPVVQGLTLGVAGLTAAVALGGGAFLVAVPKIAAYRAALETLGPTAQRVDRGLRMAGRAAGALAAVALAHELRTWADEMSGATVSADKLRLSLKETGDVAKAVQDAISSRGIVIGEDQLTGLKQLTTEFGSGFADMQNSWLGSAVRIASLGMANTDLGTLKSNVAALDQTMAEFAQSGDTAMAAKLFDEFARRAKDAGLSTEEISGLLPKYREAQLDASNATQGAAQPLRTMAEVASDAEARMNELADAIRGYNSAANDVLMDSVDAYQAIDDAWSHFKSEDFQATLDITTQAGRDNTRVLNEVAQSWNEVVASAIEAGEPLDQVATKSDTGRNALFQMARQFHATDEEAWKYVDTLMKTPSEIRTQVVLNGVQTARAELNALVNDYNGRQLTMRALIQTYGDPGAAAALGNANGGLYSYANGGFGEGIYSGQWGPLYKFAEPGTGWEAFISGRPGQEERNTAIALEALARLGWRTNQLAPAAGSSAAQPVQVVLSDRPIYTDNGAFVGMIREIANGEARLEIAGYDQSQRRGIDRGYAREFA